MSRAHFHEPHQPNNDVPEEFEPGTLPVEPDVGPVPALIPGDHGHNRAFDFAASQAWPAKGTRRHGEQRGRFHRETNRRCGS